MFNLHFFYVGVPCRFLYQVPMVWGSAYVFSGFPYLLTLIILQIHLCKKNPTTLKQKHLWNIFATYFGPIFRPFPYKILPIIWNVNFLSSCTTVYIDLNIYITLRRKKINTYIKNKSNSFVTLIWFFSLVATILFFCQIDSWLSKYHLIWWLQNRISIIQNFTVVQKACTALSVINNIYCVVMEDKTKCRGKLIQHLCIYFNSY